MKIYFVITLLCSGFYFNGLAQINLVPNSSFEDTIHCPTGLWGELWKDWYPSLLTTTDYYHLCLSLQYNQNPPTPPYREGTAFQNPHSGVAFIGIVATNFYTLNNYSGDSSFSFDYRETVASRLKVSLNKDKYYCGNYFCSLGNWSGYAIRSMGIYFTEDSLLWTNGVYPKFPLPAQIVHNGNILADTMNWMKVEGAFRALGTEKFIHIGNFNKLGDCGTSVNIPPYWGGVVDSMAYYLIDDVSLYELSKLPTAANHAYNCAAQTVTLRCDTGFNYRWYYLPDTVNVLSTADTFVVDASTAKNVLLRATLCSTEFADTVLVPKLDCTGLEDNLLAQGAALFPNPASQVATFSLQGTPPPGTRLYLSDLNGRELRSFAIAAKTTELDLSGLSGGVYFVSYRFKENTIWKGKMCVME